MQRHTHARCAPPPRPSGQWSAGDISRLLRLWSWCGGFPRVFQGAVESESPLDPVLSLSARFRSADIGALPRAEPATQRVSLQTCGE